MSSSLQLHVTITLVFFCLWFELCVSPKVVATGNVTGDAAALGNAMYVMLMGFFYCHVERRYSF
jgi:hypothetical protein